MKEKEKIKKRKMRQSSGVCSALPIPIKLSETQIKDLEIEALNNK